MAVKKVTQVSCDRCGKVIEGVERDPDEKKPPLLYVEGSLLTEATKIHFIDLCSKCIPRAQTLLSQLRLDETSKGDDAKADSGDNTAAASNQKPSTPKAAPAAKT
jgi:hypothetical protein